VELPHVFVEFLHLGAPLIRAAHIVKFIEVIGVIGEIGIHVIVAIEAPVLVLFVLHETLSCGLTPLREWILFYFLNNNSVTNQSYNSKITSN